MSTTTLASLGILTVCLILYVLKRRSRVRRDDVE
jgi:hypothetical protein